MDLRNDTALCVCEESHRHNELYTLSIVIDGSFRALRTSIAFHVCTRAVLGEGVYQGGKAV